MNIMKTGDILLLAALAAGCDQEGAMAMNPSHTAEAAPILELSEVKSGTTFNIGKRCRAGVTTVDRQSVVVSVWLTDEARDPAMERKAVRASNGGS
jgi:hypothetical protein